MDTPIDLLMYLRTIIYWFTTWTPSQIIQCSTHFTTNYKLLRAAAHTACIALTKACGGRDRWRHTVLIRHIKRFNKTVHIHTRRVHTNTHANQVMLRESVLPLSLYGCVQRLIWLAGWLCWFWLVTVSLQCTPNTTHTKMKQSKRKRKYVWMESKQPSKYHWNMNTGKQFIGR